jgi:hypothetical protein
VEPRAATGCPVLVCRRGLDDRAIDALRERRPDRVAIVEPTPQDLASQLTTEPEVSPRHLRTTLDR